MSGRRTRHHRSFFALALAGSVIASLLLSAPPAFAACFTFQGGSATTTLRCFSNTNTNSAPFVNTDPNNPSTSSVIQVFNSNIAVNIDKGVTVDGLGFSIQTEGTGHNIAIANAGSVRSIDTLFNALFAMADGPITYAGNGSVGGVTFLTTGTGGIQIGTAAAPITWVNNSPSNGSGAHTKTGDIGVFLSGGTMTGGMFLGSDAGKIEVSLTGHTAINSDSPRSVGISAETAGPITISSDADFGGVNRRITQGIQTHSSGGPISIIQAGNVFANTLGITAINSGTSGNVSVTSNGAVSVVGGIGLGASIIGANPDNVTIRNNGNVNTSAGPSAETGIFATTLGSGSVFVDVKGNVSTSSDTRSTGIAAAATAGTVTIDIASGATVSAGGTAIVAGGASGATIFNAGTITGAAAAIQFGGTGNTLTLAPGSVINGKVLGTGSDTLQLAGTGIDTFDVSRIAAGKQYVGFTTVNKLGDSDWTLTGTSTYTGATNVNAGTLGVNGSIASSNLTTVNAGATLTGTGSVGTTVIASGGAFIPGNGTPGSSMTVAGNLAFQSGALYLVGLNPSTSSLTNVTGTAALNGGAAAVFLSGNYLAKQYTILTAAGGVIGKFDSLVNSNIPANFKSSLSYDSNNAYLNLALIFVPPPGTGLNGNQQSVANAIVNFFNTNGTIPLVFGGLTPAGLSQISGEVATGSQQTTFDAMNLFMGLLTDPFIAGRGDPVASPGGAPQFADEADANAYASNGHPRSKGERDAYAAVYRKAPVVADPFVQRWSTWAAGYGGSQTTDGNTALGSNNTRSSIGGVAVGADYRFSPFTLAGFAIAGGATGFSVNGLGSGRSDLFQAGAFVRHNNGPTYISGALAYGWQDITTDRTLAIAGADVLRARFNANAFSGRVEGGYRFVSPWMAMGLTPYAAGQFTTFDLPAYAEQAIAGANTFALAYGAKSVTASRSELGLRSDKSFALENGIFTLRGRAAWAHNFNPDRTIAATFQTLPGASFVVNGAAQAADAALVTGSAEMKWLNGVSLAATFEGEFSGITRSYAGKGIARYSW
jgi:autotransporter-associated beta strand protein